MSINYSELSISGKCFGIGTHNFFLAISGHQDFKANYFESLLNDKRQIQLKDLGCKLVSLFAPIGMPLISVFVLLNLAYRFLREEQLIKSIVSLITAPFVLVAQAIVTPFIMLANLVDLIGSLIYTLADACCPQPSHTH